VDCLRVVASYHRSVHGLGDDQLLFIYLAVDEINEVIMFNRDSSTNNKLVADNQHLESLAKAMRSLSSPFIYVLSLLAGTHVQDIHVSLLDSSTNTVNLKINRLSDEETEEVLCEQLVLLLVIDYNFNEYFIPKAKYGAEEYLHSKSKSLTEVETIALPGAVLIGQEVLPEVFAKCWNCYFASIIILYHRPKLVQVFIPRLMFDSQAFQQEDIYLNLQQLVFSDLLTPMITLSNLLPLSMALKDILFDSANLFLGVRSISLQSFFSGAVTGSDAKGQVMQSNSTISENGQPKNWSSMLRMQQYIFYHLRRS
jgi:hypothetical protein